MILIMFGYIVFVNTVAIPRLDHLDFNVTVYDVRSHIMSFNLSAVAKKGSLIQLGPPCKKVNQTETTINIF